MSSNPGGILPGRQMYATDPRMPPVAGSVAYPPGYVPPGYLPGGHLPAGYPPGTPIYHQPYPTPRKSRRTDWNFVLLQVVIVGYMTFGKSFATLGVAPLLIAEPLLVYYYLRQGGKVLSNLLGQLIEMRGLALAVVAVFVWGIIDVARPVMAHQDPMAALRTCAFDYYPLYIFAGIQIGKQMPFETFILFWKRFLICYFLYTIAFYTIGTAFDIDVPWGDGWPLFMLPFNPPFAPLLVLCLWPLLKKWNFRWLAMPGAIYPMLESTGRGSFLGFGIGLAAVACASKKHRVVVVTFMLVAIGLLSSIGPLIPGDKSHSDNLDPIIQVARVIATVNPDMAYNMLEKRGYHEAARDILNANGTAQWRTAIWRNCMNSLNTTQLLLMGQGHGTPLVKYVPDGQLITTPHNFLIYAIFYTGEIGLGLFLVMLIAMLVEARRISEPTVWAIYVSNIVMTAMVAAVGNCLETPMAAVPFYLISGICLGLKVPTRDAAAIPNYPYQAYAYPPGTPAGTPAGYGLPAMPA